MTGKTKRIISIVASVAMVVSSIIIQDNHGQAAAFNEVCSGEYGDDINWLYYKGKAKESSSVDAEEGVLILEGKGKMKDLSDDAQNDFQIHYNEQGWFRELFPAGTSENSIVNGEVQNLNEIFIGDEITSIGENTFFYYRGNLKTMRLGKSVETLSGYCLNETELDDIYIYGTLQNVSETAFSTLPKTIHVSSEQTKNLILEKFPKANIMNDLSVDDTPLRIAIKKGTIKQKINPEGTGYAKGSWSTLASALEAGQSALDTLGEKEENENIVNINTTNIENALQGLVSLEVLNKAVSDAEQYNKVLYTAESWNELEEALENGKTALANDSVTADEVNTAALAITAAISNLEKLDLNTLRSNLKTDIETADHLIQSDYSEESWSALQTSLENAKLVTDSEDILEISVAAEQLQNAINALDIEYPALWYGLARLPYGKMTTILSGKADKEIAGTVKAEVIFDCMEDTSYNPYTTIELRYNEQEKYYQKFTGTDTSYTNGAKGWKETLEIPEIKEGDSYKLEGWTYCWSEAKGDVFCIVAVNFYDAKDNLIKSFEAENTEGPEGVLGDALEKAEERANAIIKSDYTEESVTTLNNSITSVKELLAALQNEEKVLPSVIRNAVTETENAVSGLNLADTTAIRKELSNTVSDAKALNQSEYTADSWKELQNAIVAAENVADDATISEVEALKKAVDDAVQGLKKVTPATTQAPNNTSNPSTGGSINSPAPTAPTTVKKPGKPAIKKVTAKKSKLTVKLKKKISGATGYQIVVSNTKKFKKTNKVTVKNGKKVTISVKYKKLKIKKGKKYFIKVRAVKKANGKNVYGKYSGVKKFTAK